MASAGSEETWEKQRVLHSTKGSIGAPASCQEHGAVEPGGWGNKHDPFIPIFILAGQREEGGAPFLRSPFCVPSWTTLDCPGSREGHMALYQGGLRPSSCHLFQGTQGGGGRQGLGL